MAILDKNLQEITMQGGKYTVALKLSEGSAFLEYRPVNSSNWFSVGTLLDNEGVVMTLPGESALRITKTGLASIEVSRV